MAWIVHHNDKSERDGYIRNGSKEVKLFTSSLKAFQCNNRIVMAQRKHLNEFYVVELIDDWYLNPAGSIRGTWYRSECHLQGLATIPR
ncbi:uncharacterized protein TNCV_2774861 [Trichonephila clavipes]|nr:uncharacterized protein TNCV_2774861 [Trichonephila clavipes]